MDNAKLKNKSEGTMTQLAEKDEGDKRVLGAVSNEGWGPQPVLVSNCCCLCCCLLLCTYVLSRTRQQYGVGCRVSSILTIRHSSPIVVFFERSGKLADCGRLSFLQRQQLLSPLFHGNGLGDQGHLFKVAPSPGCSACSLAGIQAVGTYAWWVV